MRGTSVRTAIRSAAERDDGFTVVEMAITMVVMAVVATSVTAVAIRMFTDTATITNRRDVFNDARFALDQLSAQLRQGESVDSAASTASSISFSSYANGASTAYIWRASGSSAPYSLEASRDGGMTYALVLPSSLSSNSVFTYTSQDGVVDQVTIELSLQTSTSTVLVSSNVQLRNALT